MKLYGVILGGGDGRGYIHWFTQVETVELVCSMMEHSDGLIPTLGTVLTLPDGITPEIVGLKNVCVLNAQEYIESLGYTSLKEYRKSLENSFGY